MDLNVAQEQIVRYGRKLVSAGLTTGTGGNLSLCCRDRRFAISPSGIPYDEIQPADVVFVDAKGKKLAGNGRPTSELDFHLALYRCRPDVQAVVHTHSVYATTLACLNWEIPAVHYLVGFCGHKVPLAPYATFGTRALAQHVARSIGAYQAVLLANHGLVAVGPSLSAAFSVAEHIEFVARIYYQARNLGTPRILSAAEMEAVIEKFETYGRQLPKKDKP